MRRGLEKGNLKPQDFADCSPIAGRGEDLKRKEFPKNRGIVKSQRRFVDALSEENAEITGPRWLYESQYGNSATGFECRRFRAWSVEVPGAEKYETWLDGTCTGQKREGNAFVHGAETGDSQARCRVPENWGHV